MRRAIFKTKTTIKYGQIRKRLKRAGFIHHKLNRAFNSRGVSYPGIMFSAEQKNLSGDELCVLVCRYGEGFKVLAVGIGVNTIDKNIVAFAGERAVSTKDTSVDLVVDVVKESLREFVDSESGEEEKYNDQRSVSSSERRAIESIYGHAPRCGYGDAQEWNF